MLVVMIVEPPSRSLSQALPRALIVHQGKVISWETGVLEEWGVGEVESERPLLVVDNTKEAVPNNFNSYHSLHRLLGQCQGLPNVLPPSKYIF